MLVRNSAFWNPDHPRNRKRCRTAYTSPVYWDWKRTHWLHVKTDNPKLVSLGVWAKDLNVPREFRIHYMGMLVYPHMRSFKRKCGGRKQPKSNAPRAGKRRFVWK